LKKAFDAAPPRVARWARERCCFVDEVHRFNRAQQDFRFSARDGKTAPWCWSAPPPKIPRSSSTPRCCRGARVSGVSFARRGPQSKNCSFHAEKIEGRNLPLDEEGARPCWRAWPTAMAAPALTAGRRGLARRAPRGRNLQRHAVAGYPATPPRRSTTSRPTGTTNLISALHKSVRGSDPDAALYYLARRMMDAGEDPLFLARAGGAHGGRGHRPCRSNRALVICNAAKDAYDFLGPSRGAKLAIRAKPSSYLATRAEVERRLQGVRRGDARGQGGRVAAAAQAYPEFTDEIDEVGRLWQRLRIRPRRAGGFSPARTIFRTRWDGRPSTIRPTAASSARVRKRLDYWAKLRRERS